MRLETTIKPTQTITPQMIQVMTILQYGTQELAEYLRELSYENPIAEVTEPTIPADFADKLKWLGRTPSYSSASTVEDPRELPIPSVEDQTLGHALREQLMYQRLSSAVQRGAKAVIDLLDDHGFFTGTLQEVMSIAHCSKADAAAGLKVIQTMAPLGVACSGVQEYLLFQLKQLPDTMLAQALLQDYFHLIGKKTPGYFAALLHTSEEEIRAAMLELSDLNLYPADGFAAQSQTIYVQPDLYIENIGDTLTLHSSDFTLPSLNINTNYLSMLEQETDPEVQKYLRQKLSQVQQVMYGLQNRKSTLLRCGEVLLQRQRDYFMGDILQPLTLQDVAIELNVHISTVSRTVKNKYIQCTRGIIPMSQLFSRSAGQNTSFCRETIKDTLREIIASENKHSPYSDETLSRLLQRKNIYVSRRVVAKYRSEMRIPPAYLRKLS